MIARTYTAIVTYRRPDGTTGSVVSGAASEVSARTAALSHVAYYEDLGYSVASQISADCAICTGSGEVLIRRKFGGRRIACRTCAREGASIPIG